MTKNTFLSYLSHSSEEIERCLSEVLDEMLIKFEKTSPQISPLAKTFADGCQAGKRVRAVLVKLGFELTGHEYTPEILIPAVAFEIFQTAILAHDDIIDKSPLRRGKPTIYHALGGDHPGISRAICLGDIGFFWAFKLLSESHFPMNRKVLAISSFSKTVLDTSIGQILDVQMPYSMGIKNQKDIFNIFELKTAWYTITGPLHLGAILGGAGSEYLTTLTTFGQNLGIAFQIQDDILGVFGEERITGKSSSSDIEEGKNTLLIMHAISNSTKEQKRKLESIYGAGKMTTDEVNTIRQIFIDTGALQYARVQAAIYADRAKSIISQLSDNANHVQLLNDLASFLIEREQ